MRYEEQLETTVSLLSPRSQVGMTVRTGHHTARHQEYIMLPYYQRSIILHITNIAHRLISALVNQARAGLGRDLLQDSIHLTDEPRAISPAVCCCFDPESVRCHPLSETTIGMCSVNYD